MWGQLSLRHRHTYDATCRKLKPDITLITYMPMAGFHLLGGGGAGGKLP